MLKKKTTIKITDEQDLSIFEKKYFMKEQDAIILNSILAEKEE